MRLLQVDDVDAVALAEDVVLHLRVPALGLVPEVDAGFEQLLHGDGGDGHGRRVVTRRRQTVLLGSAAVPDVGARACRPPVTRGLEMTRGLTLAELEAAARALLSVLLALLDARVAGEEAAFLSRLRSSRSNTHSAREMPWRSAPAWAADAAAVEHGDARRTSRRLGDRERLLAPASSGPRGRRSTRRWLRVVQVDLAGAGRAGARGRWPSCASRSRSTRRCAVLKRSLLLLDRSRGLGFCAWCGCRRPRRPSACGTWPGRAWSWAACPRPPLRRALAGASCARRRRPCVLRPPR